MIIYVRIEHTTQNAEDVSILASATVAELEVLDDKPYAAWIATELETADFLRFKLQNCIENRVVEYTKLNQPEMQFDDLINNTTTWQDAILAIKAKFPKEAI
tara:strand:- start:72 stop:377 length:306 start_codon:yes stop_codon:yes gene_type:complete